MGWKDGRHLHFVNGDFSEGAREGNQKADRTNYAPCRDMSLCVG